MKYIVDSNVVSEPTKPQPNHSVVRWLLANESLLAVNPIILGEIEAGILALPAGRRRTWLVDWFESGLAHFTLLKFDQHTAKVWAHLVTHLRRKGHAMAVIDSFIAASALEHDLTVCTRNTKHYRHAGVRIFNPFAP